MLYVGLDIHSKHTCACALNEQGQVTHRTRARALDGLLRFLKGLPGRFEVTTRFSACHLVGTLDDAMAQLGYAPVERGPGSVRYRTCAARWPAWKNADITVTVRDHMLELTGPVRTLRALRRQLSC